MAYWIKLNDGQKQYLVNLERVGAFCAESNQRIKFWLPDSGQPIIIPAQSRPEEFQKLCHYLESITSDLIDSDTNVVTSAIDDNRWIKIHYERREYFVNLNRIQSFACDQGKRITFWLPDSMEPIILSPQSYPEVYQKVQAYIEATTGYTLP
ncbi:MAG: hypothetical protein ACFBSC_16440 [Microcoleaceae cyanobacterium]